MNNKQVIEAIEAIEELKEMISKLGIYEPGKNYELLEVRSIDWVIKMQQVLDLATECMEREEQIEKIINDVFSIGGLNQCNAEMYIALEKIKEVIE